MEAMSTPEGIKCNETAPIHIEPDFEGLVDRQSCVRASHPRQAVVAHQIHNSGGITYETNNFLYRPEDHCTIPMWLSKLSPLRFDEKYRHNCDVAKETPGTWNWLLKSPEFISWRDWQVSSEDGNSRRLLCSGILGAGKTVLASIVFEHLRSEPCTRNSICLLIYFDFRDREKFSLHNLYISLLSQLVRQCRSFTKELQEAFHAWKTFDTFPSPDEYLKMLIAEMNSVQRIYIVIDALDECPDEERNSTRSKFLKSLRLFPSNTHILFTSRPDPRINKEVQGHDHIEVVAKQDDLLRYLHGRIADNNDLQLLFPKKTSQATLFNHIVERSKGMFLMAQINIDYLLKLPPSELEEGVKALPETPDDAYKRTWDRIVHLGSQKQALALRCLKWLILARRPLKIQELLHAISIKIRDTEIQEVISVTEENVTAVCAGIVVVDPGTRIVRLAHYTATKYLEQNRVLKPGEFHSEMAETCLTYLSLVKTHSTSQPENDVELRYPFLNYAADYWGHHVLNSTKGRVLQKACEFLQDESKLEIALTAMSKPCFETKKGVKGLHIAAYFNLSRLVRGMIEKRKAGALNAQTTDTHETAVHWATSYRHVEVLKVLIDKGADLDTKDSQNRTALHKATMNDDYESARIILESKRADTQAEDLYNWTPLRWAASNGQESIVRLLLKHNDRIDAQDKDGWTALRWAAHKGNSKIVKLLIREKALLQNSCQDDWTLLSWAAREGKYEFINLLANERVALDGVDSDGETALKQAIRYGHGKTVFALLEAGANVNVVDSKNRTPLHLAVEVWNECSNKTVVWLLLESGADINAQTKNGYTPLHLAAMKGHNLLVWLLLQKGADPSLQDNAGQTALHLAVVEGYENVVPSLLWDRKIVCMRNNEGRTALHEAASAGKLKLVTALIQGMSKIDTVDRQGCTALHRAVMQQHEDVVLCLISNHANVDLVNRKKNTALHEAAASGNRVIIKALLEKGRANKALVNGKELTPGQVARNYGYNFQEL